MSTSADRATTLARWWVGGYTRTAPEPAASDRRAEIESDLFEQVRSTDPAAHSTWSVVGRTVRGIPDDLMWRVAVEHEPGRLDWHLAHPATLLGTSLVVDVLLGNLCDASVHRFPLLTPLAALMHPSLLLVWAFTVAFALVAMTRWRPHRNLGRLTMVDAWRRASICTMSVAGSLAGLWRFAPDVWGRFAGLAWGIFGVAVLVYLITWLTRGIRSALTVLDFEKVSS